MFSGHQDNLVLCGVPQVGLLCSAVAGMLLVGHRLAFFSSWSPLLGPVLVRVTIAVKKHSEQVHVGREWFILFIIPHHCSLRMEIRTRTQTGRNTEAGIDAAAMQGCSLPCTTCSLTELKTTSSGMVGASNGLSPPP